MCMLIRVLSGRLYLVPVVLIAQSIGAEAGAQAVSRSASQSSVPSRPAAIYLDELEVIAEPQIVGRENRQDKYDDGQLRLEQQVAKFSDNHFEADGSYREFYPNGKLFTEGQFRRGRQEGEWSYWFDNGQLNRKATYKNGQPDGSWEVFRADGTRAAKRSFKDGLRDGEWIVYDKLGKQPLREEHYADGKIDGVWKVWFPDGKLNQQVGFKQGQREGITCEWNEEGVKVKEFTYVGDKLDGTAMQMLANGRKLVQQYKDGKLIQQSKQ